MAISTAGLAAAPPPSIHIQKRLERLEKKTGKQQDPKLDKWQAKHRPNVHKSDTL